MNKSMLPRVDSLLPKCMSFLNFLVLTFGKISLQIDLNFGNYCLAKGRC